MYCFSEFTIMSQRYHCNHSKIFTTYGITKSCWAHFDNENNATCSWAFSCSVILLSNNIITVTVILRLSTVLLYYNKDPNLLRADDVKSIKINNNRNEKKSTFKPKRSFIISTL